MERERWEEELTFSMFIHPPNPAPRSKTGVSLGSSDLTILSPDTLRKEVVGAILALCVVLWNYLCLVM